MNLTKHSEMIGEFNRRYQEFLEKCDEYEYSDYWSKKEDGELDAFLASDIVCVAIRLTAVDGKYTGKETIQFNSMFSTQYTATDISELYDVYGENIDHVFEEEIPENYEYVKKFDEELANEYAFLLQMVGEIVAASDKEVTEAEKDLIAKLATIVK